MKIEAPARRGYRRLLLAFLLMVLAAIDWGMLIANAKKYVDLQEINMIIQKPLMEYGIVGFTKHLNEPKAIVGHPEILIIRHTPDAMVDLKMPNILTLKRL
jgi:hypothetical protein